MSRLTEKQSAGYDLIEMNGAWCDNYCGEQSKATCRDCAIWKAIQKLAHYEDLEEQGRLIELPCKVGSEIYAVGCGTNGKRKIVSSTLDTIQSVLIFEKSIGNGIYLTKEEAEAKLRELNAHDRD